MGVVISMYKKKNKYKNIQQYVQGNSDVGGSLLYLGHSGQIVNLLTS